MWDSIKSWFANQGGFSHVVAGIWSSAFIAYAVVPPFHQFVIDVWAKTPPFAREGGVALIGLVAWYQNTHKVTVQEKNV
ncbi:MAG TPA: hypothetical protein VMS08_05005 [Candidatus Saccharimonadia bacterium]|nr:hypothetical protein [Candidatus Saccharimonadia bacterium]